MTRRACWIVAAITACRLSSQTATPPPAFEVATIKPDPLADGESGGFEHGRLTIRGAPLRHLIGAAYEMRIDLVQGGPSWVDTTLFAVEAKTDPSASEATSRLMLRTLLAERFKLKVHAEDKPTSVFVLKLAKNGPKLEESAAASQERPGCFTGSRMRCRRVTMATFCDALRRLSTGVDVPVVNETGLTGRYDFEIHFALQSNGDTTEKPTIFVALRDQLGLELHGTKRPIGIVAIDRVEPLRPEN